MGTRRSNSEGSINSSTGIVVAVAATLLSPSNYNGMLLFRMIGGERRCSIKLG